MRRDYSSQFIVDELYEVRHSVGQRSISKHTGDMDVRLKTTEIVQQFRGKMMTFRPYNKTEKHNNKH